MAGKSFATPGSDAVDLDAASLDRMVDAKALIAANRPAAAIAAGLYALEIRLKVLVCTNLDVSHLPTAVQFHDLENLLVLAGLSRRIREPALAGVRKNWERVQILAEQLNNLRYLPDSRWTLADAAVFLGQLEHPTDGVLTWLSTP